MEKSLKQARRALSGISIKNNRNDIESGFRPYQKTEQKTDPSEAVPEGDKHNLLTLEITLYNRFGITIAFIKRFSGS
jgi:hypothetical protein